MAITIAEKVLIVGGVLNLACGTLLGYPITVIRAKGAPATPRYRRLHPARRSCLPRWAIANTRKPRCNSARSARPWVGRHRDMPCLGKPPWYIDHDPQARGES